MEKSSIRYGEPSMYFTEEVDEPKKKRYKKDAYFSDEEEIDDDTWNRHCVIYSFWKWLWYQ